MKISVLIPTFNSAAFIEQTLGFVFCQTRQPDEILVLDDGSTDETVSILKRFGPRISILCQKNKGVAAARNVLINCAQGDLVAFLDHDDLWNPEYLEAQERLYKRFPQAVAYFTGHVNFTGFNAYRWPDNSTTMAGDPARLIAPLNFLEEYNKCPGPYASMSFCCIPKCVLKEAGEEPFSVAVSGADDFYLCNFLPLLGPVAYDASPLVAYRITSGAQSSNQLRGVRLAMKALESLQGRYSSMGQTELSAAFDRALVAKKRYYAKMLMGVGTVSEARYQLSQTLIASSNPLSLVKSLALWFSTFLPRALQPAWPSDVRHGKSGSGA